MNPERWEKDHAAAHAARGAKLSAPFGGTFLFQARGRPRNGDGGGAADPATTPTPATRAWSAPAPRDTGDGGAPSRTRRPSSLPPLRR